MKLLLADSGRPLWYQLDESTNLGSLIVDKCGEQSAPVFDHLIQLASDLNAISDVTQVIPSGKIVAVPFCHKIERDIQVEIVEGQMVGEILIDHTGFQGPATLRAVMARTTGVDESVPTDEAALLFASNIQPETVLTLPYASSQRLFIPVEGGFSPEIFLSEHPPTDFQASHLANFYIAVDDVNQALQDTLVRNGVPGGVEIPEGESPDSARDGASLRGVYNAAVRFDELVQFENLAAATDCDATAAIEPFDLDAVIKRVQAEVARLERAGNPATPSIVGVIDTGLATVGQGLFLEHRLHKNDLEFDPGLNHVTDDTNEYVDDVWGINFVENDGDIAPFPHADERRMGHGSQVASLVLGGPSYLNRTDAPSLTQLIIVNFGSRVQEIQPPDNLLVAVEYMSNRRTDIVNMSLSTGADIYGLEERIKAVRNATLFVVAAGNTVPRGNNLAAAPRYPALWGNNVVFPNLVTVAAVDTTGNRAPFSNYGDTVDIYAPGCSMRTVDHTGAEVIDAGTSLAAAHVSFVSSLIRAMGGPTMRPQTIKNRLIESADSGATIGGVQTTGPVLNTVKAISVTHDVIEMAEEDGGASELRFGSFANIDLLRQYCRDEDTRTQLSNIIKITPNIRRNGSTWIRFRAAPRGIVTTFECEQANDGAPLPGFTDENGNSPELSLTEIGEILIASRRL